MRIIYSAIFLAFVSGCSLKAQEKPEITTSNNSGYNVESNHDSIVIPNEYKDIIELTKIVKWYLLDSSVTTKDSIECLNGWEILASAEDSTIERLGALGATLTYGENFPKTDYVKECTFLPDVAIEFATSVDTLIVAYSFYCDLCRFQKGDKYIDLDGELVRNDLLQFAVEIFPKDKYIRQLNKRRN